MYIYNIIYIYKLYIIVYNVYIYININPPHRRGGIAIQCYAYVCVWVSMCLVFFGVFGWIPMAPELRVAWSPMASELRVALKT